MEKSIIVKTTFNGEHKWENAPDSVKFLREYHPHTFFVEAEIEVYDDDRELEFFTVKRYLDLQIQSLITPKELYSCESFAEIILNALKSEYPNRDIIVSVFEDNVNGARLRYYE